MARLFTPRSSRLPQDARRLAGFQLRQVQRGLEPADCKPMTTIGPGVCELRIHTALEHRICYMAKFRKPFMCSMLLRNAQGRGHNVTSRLPGSAIRRSWRGDEMGRMGKRATR